jgi:lipopolysaccharide export system protein LptC
MSEAARRERAIKRHWAEPGSRHDYVVKLTKFVLPLAIAGLVALLALAPFDKRGDVSFILDKNKVDEAPERMRVEAARYTGTDDKGQLFAIGADRAIQPTSDQPVVAIEGMRARLDMAKGPLSIVALKGRYDLDKQSVAIDGPVRVAGPDGYKLETRDVGIDLKRRQLASEGRVSGAMRLGQFEAGRLSADLGSRQVLLTGGARLKIVQGAVR